MYTKKTNKTYSINNESMIVFYDKNINSVSIFHIMLDDNLQTIIIIGKSSTRMLKKKNNYCI